MARVAQEAGSRGLWCLEPQVAVPPFGVKESASFDVQDKGGRVIDFWTFALLNYTRSSG